MSDISRAGTQVEGVPPEKTAEVRTERTERSHIPRDFNQPYFTSGDYLAGLVAAAVIWGPLAAGGLFR